MRDLTNEELHQELAHLRDVLEQHIEVKELHEKELLACYKRINELEGTVSQLKDKLSDLSDELYYEMRFGNLSNEYD